MAAGLKRTPPVYETRPTVRRDAMLGAEVGILHPERVMLMFEHGQSVDIGALCYLSREPRIARQGGRQHLGRKVVVNSYDSARAAKIRMLIAQVVAELKNSGRRSRTVAGKILSLIAFMDWTDDNGYRTALDGDAQSESAIREYVGHLRERVRAGTLSNNTAACEQRSVISIMSDFLDRDDLTHGLNLLSTRDGHVQPTVPPCEESQAKVLAMCEALFNGITPFLLENQPYPHRLVMPGYLAWNEEGLWMFPTTKWCLSPPDRSSIGGTSGGIYLAYNYSNGRLRTKEEILRCNPSRSPRNAATSSRRAARLIANANANPFHPHRQQLGKLASNAFVLLFVAQTGMSVAQLANLPWNGNFEVGVERQQFRSVKARAGGREVFFEIPSSFLPTFRLYLTLRDYVLHEETNEFLFPLVAKPAFGNDVFKRLFSVLHMIDPQLPRIKSRQWRAAKSDWLIKNTDIATTALILQNSERTVVASYAAGSATGHLDEMADFLDRVTETVVSAGQAIEQGIDRAVGTCTSVGEPNPVAGASVITPDCKGSEGCLFCDKFKVHADERDTRKLLSCQYCIGKTLSLFKSEEKFQQVVNPALARIQQLLDEIARRDELLVKRVTQEVLEEGELDPYWASTMTMFIELGVA